MNDKNQEPDWLKDALSLQRIYLIREKCSNCYLWWNATKKTALSKQSMIQSCKVEIKHENKQYIKQVMKSESLN